MTEQERRAIRHIVKADELLREARNQLCNAMVILPDFHPARQEIETRWRSLYADKLGDPSGDGRFYDFIALVQNLCHKAN